MIIFLWNLPVLQLKGFLIWRTVWDHGLFGGLKLIFDTTAWLNQYATSKSLYNLMKIDIIIWKVVTILFNLVNVATNSFYFLDIFLTIKNPFYPRQKRCTVYTSLLALFFVTMLCWLLFSIIRFGTTISLYDLKNQNTFFTYLQWLLYILISFALIPTILVFIRLRQKGTSKELRRKVFLRHTVYFMIYILVMM